MTAIALLGTLGSSAFGYEDPSVWEARSKSGIKARFALMSDVHLIQDTTKLDVAFEAYENIGGIDGMISNGDLVYMNVHDEIYPERYEGYNELLSWYEDLSAVPNAYTMGNHEFPVDTTDNTISQEAIRTFIEGIGLNADRNGVVNLHTEEDGELFADAVYEMAGYTVVAASPIEYSNQMSPKTEAWAKAQIEAAHAKNPNKPVFYLQHMSIKDTVLLYQDRNVVNTEEFIDWIKAQPYVIAFSGHSHNCGWDPRMIWQSEAGFTAVQTPLLAGGYMSTADVDAEYEKSPIEKVSYADLIEIDENEVVRIYRMDLYNGEYIGDPYVIDRNDLRYTDARYENVNKPSFPDGAKVTVDSVGGHSVKITFPNNATNEETVKGRTHDGYVAMYRIDAINEATGSVAKSKLLDGEYWNKTPMATRTVLLEQLSRATKYRIEVTPISVLKGEGEPISTVIETTKEKSWDDYAYLTTKTLNVASGKPITAANAINSGSYLRSSLVDSNTKTYTRSMRAIDDDTITIDLEKRYIVDYVEVYPSTAAANATSRQNFNIEGSLDGVNFTILGGVGTDGNDLIPEAGPYTCDGDGNAYRYIRLHKTAKEAWAYSEIKVFADQDLTAVTTHKNAFADNYYSDSYGYPSQAVNGTVVGTSDAWISTQSGYWHFLTVDMESAKNIGYIEMTGRNGSSGESIRDYWQIYGSDEVVDDKTILTLNSEIPSSAGYTKLYDTKSASDYNDGEYIFPVYPGKFAQVISDANAYRYLTFKRGGSEDAKGNADLGEITGYTLNPMINFVNCADGIVTIEFSDVLDKTTVNSDTFKLYDATLDTELTTTVSLSEDGYTVTLTPSIKSDVYKVYVNDLVQNQYGTDLKEAYNEYTSIINNYEGLDTSKDIYTNVALGKPIETSNIAWNTDNPVTFLNDGFVGTSDKDTQNVGTAIGSGVGFAQIDLQNSFALDKVQLYVRNGYATNASYITNLKILASNDEEFESFDILDEIGSEAEDKVDSTGLWNIKLDGSKSYRYLRLERTSSEEFGVAELRAYAKFNGFLLNKDAIADAYYYHGKGQVETYAPDKAIDNDTQTPFYTGSSTYKPTKKFGFFSLDMQKRFPVGYLELVARDGGKSGVNYYSNFAIYGSNEYESVTDATKDTSVFGNNASLNGLAGCSRLYTRAANASYDSTKDDVWQNAGSATFGIALDSSLSYRYLIDSSTVAKYGIEFAEFKPYAIAQRVNSVDVDDVGRVTINFAGEIFEESLINSISMVDESGEDDTLTDIEIGKYTYSFTPKKKGGTITVKAAVMNMDRIPMIEDFEYQYEDHSILVNRFVGFNTRKDIYANVALGKPVTTEGIKWYTNYPASFVTDGFIGSQESINYLIGTAIGTGTGYLQIDLQNSYNLEEIQLYTRPQSRYLTNPDYRRYLKISASNDATFETYDVIDEIGSTADDTKLGEDGIWDIKLDGAKDYRYIRVERTGLGVEFGIAEIRAFAKFDAIALNQDAKASAYYQHYKNEKNAAYCAPQNALDDNLNTIYLVYGYSTTYKPTNKYTYLQIDLKKPYHVGYIELVSRGEERANSLCYQHYDIFGSNVTSAVTDESHPYLNERYMENLEGYTKLFRRWGDTSYDSKKDVFWESGEHKVFQVPVDGSEEYRYITHKTNYLECGVELSEYRIYTIAQKVNNVSVDENGRVTIKFAGKLEPRSLENNEIKLLDANNNPIAISDVVIDGSTYSFTPATSNGKLVVAQDVMNEYEVPMAEEFTTTIGTVAPATLENIRVTQNGEPATTFSANTEYAFEATFNNNEDKAVSIQAFVELVDSNGKPVAISKADYNNISASASQAINVKIKTGADVSGLKANAYVWKQGLIPIYQKIELIK